MTDHGTDPRLGAGSPELSDESIEAQRQRLRRAWLTGAPPDLVKPKAGVIGGLVAGMCIAALAAAGFGVSGVVQRDLMSKPAASPQRSASATVPEQTPGAMPTPTLAPVAPPLSAVRPPLAAGIGSLSPATLPSVPSTPTALPVPGSPVDALFLANGDTTDSFGAWPPLTWSGAPLYGPGPTGQGRAFQLNGGNGLEGVTTLGDFPAGSFYVQFDILTRVPAQPAAQDAGAYDVLAKDDADGKMSLQVYVFHDGRVIAEIGGGPVPAQYYTYSTRVVNDGAWHNVLVRRSGGHLCVLIDRNNQNITCNTVPGTTEDAAIDNPAPLTIGNHSSTEGLATGSGPVRPFVGLIDNLYLGIDPLR